MATTYSLAKKRPVHNILDGYKGTISTYIDFADTSLFPTSFTTGDTLEVCNIGKGCVVTEVIIDRVTAEGAADTIDVGYGGSAAYWFDDASLNGTTCLSSIGTAGATLPLRFTANDTIDITGASTAIGTAQIWLHVGYLRPTQSEN